MMPARKSTTSVRTYTWEGYTQPGMLEEIAAFVNSVGQAYSIGEDILYRLQAAVGEASANSWEHSYRGQRGRLRLEMERRRGYLEVRLTDWGRPFKLREAPAPRLGRDLNQVDLKGLGIFLIRKMVDGVTYRSDTQKGNVLTLKKRLSTKKG